MSTARSSSRLNVVLAALADSKRRAILRRLARGEARVTELAAPFAVSLNAISKHIKLLEQAGLVRRRRAGREHVLRFRPEPLGCVQEWIAQQKSLWESSLEAVDALLQQEDNAQTPPREAPS